MALSANELKMLRSRKGDIVDRKVLHDLCARGFVSAFVCHGDRLQNLILTKLGEKESA
jgi:hypothetical protein